jgi:predicted RNA-binding protein YlxR (DUF448 family)
MESKPKRSLLRLVSSAGRPAFDPTGKANGRGVYLCRDTGCLEKARKRKSIARGLGAEGLTEAEYEALKDALEREISKGAAEE